MKKENLGAFDERGFRLALERLMGQAEKFKAGELEREDVSLSFSEGRLEISLDLEGDKIYARWGGGQAAFILMASRDKPYPTVYWEAFEYQHPSAGRARRGLQARMRWEVWALMNPDLNLHSRLPSDLSLARAI